MIPMQTQARVSARRRRTQAERRSDMRRQLLDATVECLSEAGYHGTTTLAVEHRAGVSRGARVHHFATKAELLAGAANHLLDQLAARYDEAFAVGPDAPDRRARVRRGLKLLWSVHCRPEYVALLELSMAARTDTELRTHLRAVAAHQRQLATAAVSTYFPSLAGDLARSLVETVHAAMVGTVMRGNVEPEARADEALIGHLERLIVAYLPVDDTGRRPDGEDAC